MAGQARGGGWGGGVERGVNMHTPGGGGRGKGDFCIERPGGCTGVMGWEGGKGDVAAKINTIVLNFHPHCRSHRTLLKMHP